MSKPYAEMSLAELNAASDALDAQRAAIMAEKRALHAVRRALQAEEHAAGQGLTGREYAHVKSLAAYNGVPLIQALTTARKNKAKGLLQVATAAPADVGSSAQGA